jgi:thymidylate synthase (FAD)
LDVFDTSRLFEFDNKSSTAEFTSGEVYRYLRGKGVAKECARVVLPEGLTMSRLFMKGSMRSWMHYLETRLDPTTQKEHRDLATLIKEALLPAFPTIFNLEQK